MFYLFKKEVNSSDLDHSTAGHVIYSKKTTAERSKEPWSVVSSIVVEPPAEKD